MRDVIRHLRVLAAVPLLAALGSCSVGGGPTEPSGPPRFLSVSPSTSSISTRVGREVVFEVEAVSANGDPVPVEYRIDGTKRAEGERFVYAPEAPGERVVEAVAFDGDRRALHSWRIEVAEPANRAPTADLRVTPSSGEAPLDIVATLEGDDGDGTVVRASIDFDGDGTPDAEADLGALEAEHVYESAGTYTVEATVEDDEGATATASVTVDVAEPNTPPRGSLRVDRTEGDAPLSVSFSASGSDADGSIVGWELDAGLGDGFVAFDPVDPPVVAYPFRETPYVPRLRLTDDDGAETVAEGPEIVVYRPIDPTRSSGTASGNPHFDEYAIAPAIWADGVDALRFTVTVRDPGGEPLGGVPVRVSSLRPDLVAPDGTNLGDNVAIALDGSRTDGQGRLTGSLTTTVSSRAYGVPESGSFARFRLRVEADAGHGEWRRLPDIDDLVAETIASGDEGDGKFFIVPGDLTCVGEPLEIHVQAVRRNDAPLPGAPAGDRHTEIRYLDGEPLRAQPRAEDWRTDEQGWIVFDFVPREPDVRALDGWVDGQLLRENPSLKVVEECE